MKVIFRKFKDGNKEVIALFPEEKWDKQGNITSYMHVGQHGGASIHLASATTLATQEEYTPLLKELLGLGYENLQIRKRINIK